ncbi:hypothetical protein JG688_00009181 [Phytophthora aleatoria]|uniref:Transmembrane protein n=1 Tax=Phytophthora aleatoria TaxID=2496075 RepID=A0A8J5IU17_9STRA|nr:hypothetical protein JG688_00009181 [Phytophthora aleatoria]
MRSSTVRHGIQRIQRWSSLVYHRWQSLQVSYRGNKYSVERLLALDEYTEKTSVLRVAMVVSGALVPMVILVISQESVPLNDPREGWRANYGFWVRVGILSGVVSMAIVNQRSLCRIPYTLFCLIDNPSFFLLLLVWFTIIAGKQCIREILQHTKEVTTFVLYICTQMLMPLVYPIYEVMFYAASDTAYEIPVILLLPVIKIVMKYVIASSLNAMEDMMPKAVIFSVDFFHAVYLATCVQRTRSTVTVAIIIGTDVSQTAMVMFKLRRRTATILHRLHTVMNGFGSEDLLALLCFLCRNQDTFATQSIENVRVRSCLAHRLSPEDNNLLSKLEKSSLDTDFGWPSAEGPMCSLLNTVPKKKNAAILCTATPNPTWKSIHGSSRRSGTTCNGLKEAQYCGILRETLEMLYTMECLVLTAYLEAFIPLFYGNYMMIMVNFPNAEYHTELKNVTHQNVHHTATIVFLFGLLQVASFWLLAALISRKCGMNVLYQLAFVLETQMPLVQGKLMIWMLVTLACRVVHFGTYVVRTDCYTVKLMGWYFSLINFLLYRSRLFVSIWLNFQTCFKVNIYIYGNDKLTMQRMFDDIATKGRLQANAEQTGTSGIERKHFANLGWYSTSPIALLILCKSATGKHSPGEHSSAVPAS